MPKVYPSGGKSRKCISRGLYCGENSWAGKYIIDHGSHHIPSVGWETNTSDIGKYITMPIQTKNFLEGGLVKSDKLGGYSPCSKTELAGKSVALLFSSHSHPKCAAFLPFLKQYYKTVNESGCRKKIEVIFVSLDATEEEFEESRRQMPWLSIQYNAGLRNDILFRYKVKANEEKRQRIHTGLPRLLVVGPNGEEMHWLGCEANSAVVLKEWDFVSTAWPLADEYP